MLIPGVETENELAPPTFQVSIRSFLSRDWASRLDSAIMLVKILRIVFGQQHPRLSLIENFGLRPVTISHVLAVISVALNCVRTVASMA